MKVRNFGVMAALALAGLVATSVQAEIVTIPVATGMIGGGPDQSCIATDSANYDWSIYADPTLVGECVFEIPISVPIGHTINQIGILYGTDSQIPNPVITAYLATKNTVAPFSANEQFNFSSLSYVPQGTIASHNLMTQIGKTFPDAFVVQPNTLYRLKFLTLNGVVVWGAWINYN